MRKRKWSGLSGFEECLFICRLFGLEELGYKPSYLNNLNCIVY